VNLGAPSALNTALAFRQAIWRKDQPGWHVCGIPDDAQVAYDCISLGDVDWAHTNAVTARAEADAAENVLRAVLGATGSIAGDR